MTTEEMSFFQHHLVSMIKIKGFADAFEQFCFQMERLWFYLFQRQAGEARMWLGESEKTLGVEAFEEARLDLVKSFEAGMVKGSTVEKLLSLSEAVSVCYKSLKAKEKDSYDYPRSYVQGEHQSLALSRFILSIFDDIQRQILSAPDSIG